MSSSYAEAFIKNIDDLEPAGTDVRSLPQYETLQAEIEKLSNPHSNGSPDWPVVITLAQDLLKNSGKDILIGSYLAHALTIKNGIEGLFDGFSVIHGLIKNYWETMYPSVRRLRGRNNAVQWLVDRTESLFNENEFIFEQEYPASLIDGINKIINEIDASLASYIGEESPNFSSLKRHVQKLRSHPEYTQKSQIISSEKIEFDHISDLSSNSDKNNNINLFSIDKSLISKENLDSALQDINNNINTLSDFFLENEISDGRSYLFKRFSNWSEITFTPPHNDFISAVPGPLDQQIQILRSLRENKNNIDIINFTESIISTHPFWLDLNLACAEALMRSGEAYQQALHEVGCATSWFTHRFPEISSLKFSSGVPFADEETKKWISSLDTNIPPSKDLEKSSSIDEILSFARNDDDLTSVIFSLKKMTNLFESGKINPSELLLSKIKICEIILKRGINANLSALANDIINTVERHALESWDKNLALQALIVSYQIYFKIDDFEKIKKTIDKISSIDTSSAFELLTI